MLRNRAWVLPVVLLYIGAALMVVNFWGTDFRLGMLLYPVGQLLSIAAIVWLFVHRLEDRVDQVLRSKEELSRFGVEEMGVLARFDVGEMLRSVTPIRLRIVVNRQDVPALVEFLYYAVSRSLSSVQVLICGAGQVTGAESPHDEELHVSSWITESRRSRDRGAVEVRTIDRPASATVVFADDKVIALTGLGRPNAVYTYMTAIRWGRAAAQLQLETDGLWSAAEVYERPTA